MPPEFQAIFDDWTPPLVLTTTIVLTALVYTRGWFAIRKTRRLLFPPWRLAAFLLGLATIWFAVASPLDGFADVLLSAHMIEHLLLMSFAAPLLLLGCPAVPLLRGLPRPLTIHLLGPFLRAKWLRRLGHILTTPLVAWLAMNLIFLAWHVPTAYDFALEHEHWHEFEHLCFLASSILFWWPLIRPWPTTARYPGWFLLPYLVLADIVNTALSAFLAFCDRPVYSYYLREPNPFHIPPLADQVAGAVIMWVIGSLVFLLPAIYITIRLLQQESRVRPSPELN
jgi:cytochrome c oxidase assembly factor CtaG